MLQNDNPSVSIAFSVLWPALISLMPPHLVQNGTICISAFLLAFTVVSICRPKSITAHLDSALCRLEEKVHRAGKDYHTEEMLIVEAELKNIQLRSYKLRGKTFRALSSPWKELCAFCMGHSFSLVECLRAVDALDAKIEVGPRSLTAEVDGAEVDHPDVFV
ncbi:hypothetical protein FPV67DRAFT_1669313 [Lyophyllum atratum]|nr:hypothetical protein FPV67DRAFT_1669313 [Lyophyllum atratum]